jgi:hypothetical protein
MAYYFNGDLIQLYEQGEFLARRGFKLKYSGVYPTLESEEDYKRALKLIIEQRCAGWWHYLDEYVKYNICNEEEYLDKLGFQRDNQKSL